MILAMSAREEILGRIRSALPGEPMPVNDSYASIQREFQQRGSLDRGPCVALFIDRLLDYDSEVVKVLDESEIAEAVGGILQANREQLVLASGEVPASWLPADIKPIRDEGLSAGEIDRAQAVLTTCEVAVASTGTIFLVHGRGQGRRVATLLPDHHICVVQREQIYETLPEALAILDQNDPRPMTSISGPSATSDIEMTRIRGVHGPRRLTVVLCGPLAER